MYYYEIIDGKITQWNTCGCREHWQNCNQTDEEIIEVNTNCDGNNISLLKSNYDEYIKSDEYKFFEIRDNNNLIKKQILDLENKQPRALREFALNIEGSQDRLQEIESEIQELRSQLQ